MTKLSSKLALGALLMVLLSACVTAGSGAPGTRQDLITREEIATANVSNLYDVVQRLRPRWLTVRAEQSFGLRTEIVVYQNQTLLGGTDALRQVAPEMAQSLRYVDGITASSTLPGLGSRHVEGAIVIETGAR